MLKKPKKQKLKSSKK